MTTCINICKDFANNTFDLAFIEEILSDNYQGNHQYKKEFFENLTKLTLNNNIPFNSLAYFGLKCLNWQVKYNITDFVALDKNKLIKNPTEIIVFAIASANDYYLIGFATHQHALGNTLLYDCIGYKKLNLADLNCAYKKYI